MQICLSNGKDVTMETYQQGPTSSVPNCFGCHNYTPTTPLTVSHITKYLFPSSTASLIGPPEFTAAR